MDPLDAVFHNLDKWRHFPNYQLERRADIFFSLYLRRVVEEFTGVALEEDIIPELPIKRDPIGAELAMNKSAKVDYALFAKDRSRVFFVELKTDSRSRSDKQDAYLEAAKRRGFRHIVEGIRSILINTKAHQKYQHLAVVLERLGYLTLPEDLASYLYPEVRRVGLVQRLTEITVPAGDPPVEVIYIQPEASDGDRCIDFEMFAKHVAKFSDPLSTHFAAHLRLWRTTAGTREPK